LTVRLTGVAVRKPFATASKSERMAVVLRTDQGEYVLRRKGGLAFDDAALETLVGKRLRCSGTLSGYTFLMTECEELPDES
jgi:hypothetical protein